MTGFSIKTFIAFFTVLFAISCSDNSVTNPDDLAASTWGSGSSSLDTSVIPISGGCFEMGSTDGSSDETPVHKVCVSNFSIDRYEVTNAEYIAAMGDSAHFDDDKCGIFNVDSGKTFYGTLPASFRSDNQPMVCVDWSQAEAYCERQGKRLPTEAEWEYAARALSAGEWPCGENDSCLESVAWFKENSGGHTHPVMGRLPNYWGLSDMGGNVWEWTADWYGAGYYAASPRQNPQGPEKGQGRVIRGGGWNYQAQGLRLAFRLPTLPAQRSPMVGFRCVERR